MSVRLVDICKSYDGGDLVIKHANIEIEQGEFVVFVGPSGCGKSTLLRMIAGLESITSGELFIGDEEVAHWPPSRRGIAMVFQSYALYPHLSVFENMAFSLRIAKLPKEEIKQKVHSAAEILQLNDYLNRLPKALSGGQRQRVAIGRAIVRNPKVFLFDEPLSNLDAALRNDMRVELADLHKKLGTTMIYVTHDQVEAMTLANKIVVLNGGQVEQIGSPMDLYLTPQTPFVAGFIGSPKMNFITGQMASARNADLCGVRPEHIVASHQEGDFKATVQHMERLGAETLIYVDTEKHGKLLVRHAGIFEAKANDNIHLRLDPQHLHYFKENKRIEPTRAV